MASTDRHYAQAQAIQTALRTLTFTGFDSGDIQLIDDFENDKIPERGIYVQMVEESFGVGTNEHNDVRYACLVARVLPKVDMRDGMQSRSQFRIAVIKTFHRKRIGIDAPSSCEIVSLVRPHQMKVPSAWRRSNLDVTVLKITSLIRETRVLS